MIIYDPFHIFPNLKKYTRDLHLLQLQDMFLQAIAYSIIANTHFKQKIENFQEFPIMNALVLSVCSDEFERNRTNSNVQKIYTPQWHLFRYRLRCNDFRSKCIESFIQFCWDYMNWARILQKKRNTTDITRSVTWCKYEIGKVMQRHRWKPCESNILRFNNFDRTPSRRLRQ